jgi:hypothetical protein
MLNGLFLGIRDVIAVMERRRSRELSRLRSDKLSQRVAALSSVLILACSALWDLVTRGLLRRRGLGAVGLGGFMLELKPEMTVAKDTVSGQKLRTEVQRRPKCGLALWRAHSVLEAFAIGSPGARNEPKAVERSTHLIN